MKKLSGSKFKEMFEKKLAVAIDVDPIKIFKEGHIRGTVNIAHDDVNFIGKVQKKLATKSDNLVLCARKEEADSLDKLVNQLENAGFNNVYTYSAEPEDWKKTGLKISGM